MNKATILGAICAFSVPLLVVAGMNYQTILGTDPEMKATSGTLLCFYTPT